MFELTNVIEGQFKCKCYKYKNEEMIKDVIKKKEEENSWFNYFKNIIYSTYNNQPIEEKKIDLGFVRIDVEEGLLFADFVENEFIDKRIENENKEIVIINGKGFYYKYSFNNEQNIFSENDDNDFELINSFQWI